MEENKMGLEKELKRLRKKEKLNIIEEEKKQAKIIFDDEETNGPNDYFEDAQRIFEDDNIEGFVDEAGDTDWYKIRFYENGEANFYLEPQDRDLDVDLIIYDEYKHGLAFSSNLEGVHELITLNVRADEYYYIRVRHYGNYRSGMSYLLRCKNYPNGSSGGDNDDDFTTAESMELGVCIEGTIDKDNDQDYYKLQLPYLGYDGVLLELSYPNGGDFHCDIYLYDRFEDEVGFIGGANEQTSFAKFPKLGSSCFIRVDFDGTYDGTGNQKYELIATPIKGHGIRRADIGSLEEAYPVGINEVVCGKLEEYDDDYFLVEIKDDMDVTFVLQPEDGLEEFRMELLDSDGNRIDYATGRYPLELTHSALKGETYFIHLEPERNSTFTSTDYLLHSYQNNIGGFHPLQEGYCEILTVTKPKAVFSLNEVVQFDVKVRNATPFSQKYTVTARLRNEVDEFGTGFNVGSNSTWTLDPGEEYTLPVNVAMKKTGFKDIVFEASPGAQVTESVNCEVIGYDIDDAIADVERIENLVRSEMGNASNEDKFIEVLRVIRSFIYNGFAFDVFLDRPNSTIAAKVNSQLENIKNRLINGTILTDRQNRLIDFIHMFAVLEGCVHPTYRGEQEIRSLYTGWYGDVASEVPNIKTRRGCGGYSGTLAEKSLAATVFEKCSQINTIPCKCAEKDLEADIDAVVLNKLYNDSKNTIHQTVTQLLKAYYHNNSLINTRYNVFKEETVRIGRKHTPGASFGKVLFNAATTVYDPWVPGTSGLLSGMLKYSIVERTEACRVLYEYVNSGGSITKGESLTWNNHWYN